VITRGSLARGAPRPVPGTGRVATLGDVPAPDDAAGDLPVTGSLAVPAAALHWRFSRSSGPGGQGVNTADSRVELSIAPLELPGLTDVQRQRLADRLAGRLVDGVLTVTASEHRQQLRNRQAARERLAAVLRAALAPPAAARRRTRPTRGSQERRIQAKKQRGQLKKQRRSWD
jgi:ribosome-associated protein